MIPVLPDLLGLLAIPVLLELVLRDLPVIPVLPDLLGLLVIPVLPELALQDLPVIPVLLGLLGLLAIPVLPDLLDLLAILDLPEPLHPVPQ